MTKLLTILALLFTLHTHAAEAQTLKQNTDGTYSILKTEKKSEAVNTGKFFKTAEGELKPIMRSKNGKYFVVCISKKTGNPYNKYLQLQK